MSKQLNRKVLKVNNRTSVKQHFTYVEPKMKSVATPSIFRWNGPGKGVEGETVNSTNVAASLIVNKNWKPLQS